MGAMWVSAAAREVWVVEAVSWRMYLGRGFELGVQGGIGVSTTYQASFDSGTSEMTSSAVSWGSGLCELNATKTTLP